MVFLAVKIIKEFYKRGNAELMSELNMIQDTSQDYLKQFEKTADFWITKVSAVMLKRVDY